MRKTNKYRFLLPERDIENGRDDAADINDLTLNWENADGILNAQQEKDEQIEKDLKSHRDNVLLDHPDGSVTDSKIGNRKIGPVSGSLQALFNAVESMVKAITGKTAWNEAPAINLEETKKHVSNKSNPHSVTKEQAGLGNVDNIQQAAKIDFDKHNTDEIRHIKNEERALWNDNIENAGKHIANADIHVALEDKENWNNTKADFSSHSSDFDLHTNTAEKEKWNTVLQKADKSNVIEKDNIASFLPTEPYQPATKKYVDDKVFDSGSGDMKKAEFATNGDFGVVDKAISAEIAEKIANRIYQGVDLTVKFAQEISGFSDVWQWVKSRIQTVNYSGLNIGDYIPFTADGNEIKAEIAGIDTYYNYGDVPVGHHIDFISRDCWPETHVWNKANYNNGISSTPNPWLCSDIFAWLNSLAMEVPNTATANPTTVLVNYTASGVYDKLPTALKNVIVPKRALIPRRFTDASLLIDDNSVNWQNIGNLWLPSEIEVHGCKMWGTYVNGYGVCGYMQYPIFAQNRHLIKHIGDSGSGSVWWLSTPSGNKSTHCTNVSNNGHAFSNVATSANVHAPICFRIA